MKNKKLYISMIVLIIAFLIAMYVLKLFFPQEFVMFIENERIIAIGDYVDNHKWLYYICCGITSFITYWFYLCAVSHRLYLKWYECLYVLIAIIGIRAISLFDNTLATGLTCSMFLILPAITKGDIKTNAIVYSTHAMAQCLSLRIRELPIYLENINFLTSILMTFECYLWLMLLYIIFNIKKESENMGQICPPFYGKSKFYAKKKAKAEKKIVKLQEVIKVCDEKLSKEHK